MYGDFSIYSGSSHPGLAQSICNHLGLQVGRSRSQLQDSGNLEVQILDNVRESDVFVIQTAAQPLHQHIFELFIMIDALKSASAGRVTAVMPYMPYVRADKKSKPRISIVARLLADLLVASGADRVLTMDLHAPQVQGFFRVPTDQLQAAGILCEHLKQHTDLSNAVVCAADMGEAKDLGRYANRLDLPMAIIDRRGSNGHEQATNLIGEVEGKVALIIDDEIDTGEKLVEATEFLLSRGAAEVRAVATHGVFSGDAIARLDASPVTEVLVTNTIPAPAGGLPDKVHSLSVAPLFARAIQRIHDGTSVSALFR
jgi:ribose-phosphate pyrophosphokinase